MGSQGAADAYLMRREVVAYLAHPDLLLTASARRVIDPREDGRTLYAIETCPPNLAPARALAAGPRKGRVGLRSIFLESLLRIRLASDRKLVTCHRDKSIVSH